MSFGKDDLSLFNGKDMELVKSFNNKEFFSDNNLSNFFEKV